MQGSQASGTLALFFYFDVKRSVKYAFDKLRAETIGSK